MVTREERISGDGGLQSSQSFITKESGGTWTVKQFGGEDSLESTASSSTFELQRKLVSLLALQTAGSNSVSSSFSIITPTSAVAQVILGGGSGGGRFSRGGAAGGAPAAAEEKVEEKEEEKQESDDV